MMGNSPIMTRLFFPIQAMTLKRGDKAEMLGTDFAKEKFHYHEVAQAKGSEIKPLLF